MKPQTVFGARKMFYMFHQKFERVPLGSYFPEKDQKHPDAFVPKAQQDPSNKGHRVNTNIMLFLCI